MLRNPLAPRPVALSQTDIDHVTTIAREVCSDATIHVLDQRVTITPETPMRRTLILRRLRTLGYIAHTSDSHFLVIVGWNADHPSTRALSAEELQERITHLQALHAQLTTANQ